MKLKAILSVILVSGLYSSAQAACGDESSRSFMGDEAITLTYILKNSTIAVKSTSGNTTTWSLAKLVCRQTNRGVMPDLMPVYNCSTPSGIGPITAKSLFDAMSELGVMPDGSAGHVNEQAKTIKCKVNKDGSGGTAINPRCTLIAAWGDECG
ncbi:hypothetical protein [Bdellovibrio svalbardensis]|uniref:Secreted protein n=1 Tax=Bdellovibrio svalbardensis TaxID=2972972 RepID=A0ABT6DHL8_9BACT|nr:hypothetical protein [Bdellovibrio svalbardensis]MDG0816291.1 hypothetical protein [Bdellovibrio svalbardensis]